MRHAHQHVLPPHSTVRHEFFSPDLCRACPTVRCMVLPCITLVLQRGLQCIAVCVAVCDAVRRAVCVAVCVAGCCSACCSALQNLFSESLRYIGTRANTAAIAILSLVCDARGAWGERGGGGWRL